METRFNRKKIAEIDSLDSNSFNLVERKLKSFVSEKI